MSITPDNLNKPHARVAHCAPSCQLHTQGRGQLKGGGRGKGGVCLRQRCQRQKGADTRGAKQPRAKACAAIPFQDTDPRVKLAADEIKRSAGEKEERSAGEGSPETRGKMVRVELEWDIPMSVTLPVQVRPDPADQRFPFLDTTLADLGIKE